jgi:hypothetical protein
MNARPMPRNRGGHVHRDVRGRVQTAVAEIHRSRPGAGASPGEQAVWWHRASRALSLLAEYEADPVRAHEARADAATARRLGDGLAAAHAAEVTNPDSATSRSGSEQRLDEPDSGATDTAAGAGMDFDEVSLP